MEKEKDKRAVNKINMMYLYIKMDRDRQLKIQT